ncbi:peptidase [Cylindrospermopsis raciborskii LB2897]|uniref:PPC domain-containing protein n=1 Tax=Cylindrospermopsis raciborskii TaxID=77022 RepID=UPI001454D28E|nr:PPC domain-containing protein [Cylindrospermopsis raciborskii]MBG0744656.1 PPC domain-containing protein [Cylindrospermopsis raciborskii KL1]NLQ07190.1 peptidase [Cylindrospermopsis raciborskii LB2897]
MNSYCMPFLNKVLILPITLLSIIIYSHQAIAQTGNKDSKDNIYNPILLKLEGEITDKLTIKDIPTGQGGFARDYQINLNKGDNLVIDASSENFDTIVTLLGPNGSTVGENDDGPDGTSNSLLFVRITETGKYIIRVRSFGETGVGSYKLKVTKLLPAK